MQLPALAAGRTPDLGQTLANVATIKGANLKNKLTEVALQTATQSADARKAVLNAPEGQQAAALKKLAAVDPKAASSLVDALSRMDTRQRATTRYTAEQTGKLLLSVEAAPPEQRNFAYQRALAQAQQMGLPIKGAPAQYDPQWAQSQLMMARSVESILKPTEVAAGASLARPGTDGGYETVYTAPEKKGASATSAQKDAVAIGLKPGTPEYNDYIRKRTLKPGVQVNMGNTLATEFAKLDVDTVKGMRETASAMSDLMPRLEVVAGLLEGGNVETGRFQEATLPIKQWAQSLGYTVDENLPQAEQVASAMAYLVPRMRVAGSGSTSDREMAMFKQSAPNFANTTQGNALIARTFMQIHDRNKKASDLATKYLRKNKNLDGFEEYADEQLGSLFPSPKSEAAYKKLPRGTVYIDTDGRFKVKK